MEYGSTTPRFTVTVWQNPRWQKKYESHMTKTNEKSKKPLWQNDLLHQNKIGKTS